MPGLWARRVRSTRFLPVRTLLWSRTYGHGHTFSDSRSRTHGLGHTVSDAFETMLFLFLFLEPLIHKTRPHPTDTRSRTHGLGHTVADTWSRTHGLGRTVSDSRSDALVLSGGWRAAARNKLREHIIMVRAESRLSRIWVREACFLLCVFGLGLRLSGTARPASSAARV